MWEPPLRPPALTSGQKGWPQPSPRGMARMWVEVGDPRAEFGRSQGTKQDRPGRGPVRVCRWRGLSQAGVMARGSERSKEQGALGWMRGPARAGPGNPWACLQNRPRGQSYGGRKVLGENWQVLVPFGGGGPGPTTLSSSSLIMAAWLPLLDVGPSAGLAATVGVGFQCPVAGTPCLWISLGF